MRRILLFFAAIFSFLFSSGQTTCQWAYIPTGTNPFNAITNATPDQQGNIIETGRIFGIADMDPGPGPADTSYSAPGYNYYLSKTDANGHLLWIKYFTGYPTVSAFDFNGLRVNSQNEIVVAGSYFGLVDFDLSDAGIDTLRSHQPTYQDYFIAKYDSAGNHLWAISIGDAVNRTEIKTFTLQPNDDIVVATNTNGAVDVDPGINVHTTLGGNANIVCYDKDGSYVWNNNIATTFSYADNTKTIEGDAAGNNYLLTVGYYELTVNKFNSSGVRIWNKTIGEFSAGARVNPQSVLVNKSTGEFYVAGTFGGNVDFDPGPMAVSRNSNSISYQDGFIAKYDSSMNLVWVNAYYGNMDFGRYSMDFSGNDPILVGNMTGTVDFGNGFIFTSAASTSPFYLKIDPLGNSVDAFMLNGGGGYNTIHTGSNQSFVATGHIHTNTDMDPSVATMSLSASNTNFFTAVYSSAPTGIQSAVDVNSLRAFPNPANDFIFIQGKTNSMAHLYDIHGNELISQKLVAGLKNNLPVSLLSNGIYILEAGDSFQKIIVIH